MAAIQVTLSPMRSLSITKSKRLWLQTPLIDQLKSWIDANPQTPASRNEWNEKMQLALENALKSMDLTKPARRDLEFVAGSMGCELQTWFSALGRMPEMYPEQDQLLSIKPSICLDHVRWTDYGGIDKVETMRTLYFTRMFSRSVTTWLELAHYCLEDCLHDLHAKLPNIEELINRFVSPTLNYDNSEVLLKNYWIYRLGGEAFDKSPSSFYDAAYSIEENMFMNALVSGHHSPVIYFWDRMDKNQRTRALSKACETIINDCFDNWPADAALVRSTWEQLSLHGLESIRIRMMGSADMLSRLLDWHFEYIFMKALVESWNHHYTMDHHAIMKNLIRQISSCKDRLIDHDHIYRNMFYTIWDVNRRDFKHCITPILLSRLAESNEISLLKYILGDPELKDRRQALLNGLGQECRNLNIGPDFLANFIAKVLVPGEEWFIEWFSFMQTTGQIKKTQWGDGIL